MKKRIKMLSAGLLAMLILTACGGGNNTEPEQNVERGDANAYFVVVQKLMEEDPGLNSDIKYLAVDMSSVELSDKNSLATLVEAYCQENGYTFLNESIKSLTEKGYVKDSYFEEGVAIVFTDAELTDTLLKTNAMKWRSGLGAIGATYTVEKSGDAWEITNTENSWIS